MTTAPAADRERWDTVVVGAGITGCVAARGLARRGLAVLLVERARPPRPKVCGGCLSAAAVAALERLGLAGLPALAAAPRTGRLELRLPGATATLGLPPGRAVTRSRLDADLAAAAVDAGAVLLAGTRAEIGPAGAEDREVTLFTGAGPQRVRAVVVIDAAGLAGAGAIAGGGFHTTVARRSRIGAGAVLPAGAGGPPPGRILMSVAAGGYVGLVRAEGGAVIAAAALDPAAVREAGGPAALAARILHDCGTPPPAGLADAAWTATPPLSRRTRPVAGERLFLAGDATGYVEPFTGEGMAWALEAAAALIPAAARAARRWHPGLAREWRRSHRRLIEPRRRRCRRLTVLLRHPEASAAAVRLLARRPGLAAPLVRSTAGRPRPREVPS